MEREAESQIKQQTYEEELAYQHRILLDSSLNGDEFLNKKVHLKNKLSSDYGGGPRSIENIKKSNKQLMLAQNDYLSQSDLDN